MAAVIGALRVELSASIAKFQEDMGKAAQSVKKFAREAKKQGESIQKVGTSMSIALTAPLVAFGIKAVKESREAAQAFGQVEAALKSTGGQSGRTAEQLKKSAEALEDISTFDDDVILADVTARLLRFGNIQGQVFDDAQLAIVNLSSRLKIDLASATTLVGKALNQPILGLQALNRAGVTFTAEQKKMIVGLVDSGRGLEAQKIILGELGKQFGGAAADLRKNDPFAALNQSLRDFAETAGPFIVDIIEPLVAGLKGIAEWFNSLSDSSKGVVVTIAALVAVAGPLVFIVGGLIKNLGLILPVLAGLKAGLLGVSAVMWGWIGIIVAGVAALVIFRKAIGNLLTGNFTAAWAEAKKAALDTVSSITGMFKNNPIEIPVKLAAGGGAAGVPGKTSFNKSEGKKGSVDFPDEIKVGPSLLEAAKDAEKFSRAVDKSAIAVSRFSKGSLDPLSEKFESIDDAYDSLRNQIEENIEDNRRLATTNDAAALTMERLKKQLDDLTVAHGLARDAAQSQWEAENKIRDIELKRDTFRAQEELFCVHLNCGRAGDDCLIDAGRCGRR